jgi:transaldolase
VNPLHRLSELGQSVWLDYIDRGLLESGALARMVADDAVSGVTSNPAIFHQAITGGKHYDAAIAELAQAGLAAHEIYEALVVDDVRRAADDLAAVYRRTNGRDGYVSLEVSPRLAHDEEGTFWEAKRLAALVDRSNLMIKVPGTAEGVRAVRRLIAAGLNVNVTLLFSVDRYAEVAEAYLQGLEERIAVGESTKAVVSVASFFLSRIDTLVDRHLEIHAGETAQALRGEAAVAFAKLAYRIYRSQVDTARWRSLAQRGAQPQRLLWASTGTKNPAYSDVKYVDALVGRDTITTLPLETLSAYRDHGDPAPRLEGAGRDPDEVLARLAEFGVDAAFVRERLEADGVRKFVEPLEATLATLRSRIAELKARTHV